MQAQDILQKSEHNLFVKIYILFFLLGLQTTLHAQGDSINHRARNSFFIEYGGNGGGRYYPWEGFSLNYDRIWHVGKWTKASVRIGSNIPVKYHGKSDHLIPIMMNLMIGKKRFYFELSGGIRLYVFDSDYSTFDLELISFFGLRYQNYKKGIMARIGFTPPFGPYLFGSYIFGASVGYSF